MEVTVFIEESMELSVTARAMVALLAFERFCRENEIHHPEIDTLIEYLWRWPRITGPAQFDPWEKARPQLVLAGLSHETPRFLRQTLLEKGIQPRFEEILNSLVEILWGSFWAACDNEGSIRDLERVVTKARVKLPPLTPFRFSRFEDNHGWGVLPTESDLDYWKSLRSYA